MHMWGLIEVSSEREEKEEVFQVFLEQFAQNEDNKNDKLFEHFCEKDNEADDNWWCIRDRVKVKAVTLLNNKNNFSS